MLPETCVACSKQAVDRRPSGACRANVGQVEPSSAATLRRCVSRGRCPGRRTESSTATASPAECRRPTRRLRRRGNTIGSQLARRIEGDLLVQSGDRTLRKRARSPADACFEQLASASRESRRPAAASSNRRGRRQSPNGRAAPARSRDSLTMRYVPGTTCDVPGADKQRAGPQDFSGPSRARCSSCRRRYRD